MRAYGRGSEILIDRDMEARTHVLLAEKGLAAPFFARFNNGLLYGYLPGRACTPQELLREPVWRAVAIRLGEWHARLPLPNIVEGTTTNEDKAGHHQESSATPALPRLRTIWDVMRDWIDAIPSKSPELESRKIELHKALRKSFLDLVQDGREDYSRVRTLHFSLVGDCEVCLNIRGYSSVFLVTVIFSLQTSFLHPMYHYSSVKQRYHLLRHSLEK